VIAGVSPEILLVGLVMPIVVALITGLSAVQWRKHSPPSTNPDSILGAGHETVKQHMDFRAAEHSRQAERLATIEGKQDRLIDIAERNREVTRDGLVTVNATLGRVEGILGRIEGKLPQQPNPKDPEASP